MGPRLWAKGRTPQNEHFRSYISPIWGENALVGSAQNFALGGPNHRCKVWSRSVKGFSMARGQILGFSVGFRRRPCNTLALPYECVMVDTICGTHTLPAAVQSVHIRRTATLNILYGSDSSLYMAYIVGEYAHAITSCQLQAGHSE